MNYSDFLTMEPSTLLIYILINLALTILAYLFIPIIICLSKKKFSLTQIKKIATVNALFVAFTLMIISINNGDDSPSVGGLIWGYVAYELMKKKCLLDDDRIKKVKNNSKERGENGTTYSLSDKNEKPRKYGTYNIYGEDIMYQPSEEDNKDLQREYEMPQDSSPYHVDANSDIRNNNSHSEKNKSPQKRFSAAIPILSVILLFCCMLCFDFYFRAKDKNEYRALEEVVSKLESEKLALNDEISALNRKISGLDYAVYALENQISKNEDKLNFYDEFVVFVVDDGSNWYHKYGCELFEGDFWAYNVDNAEHKGYIPCKVCFD